MRDAYRDCQLQNRTGAKTTTTTTKQKQKRKKNV